LTNYWTLRANHRRKNSATAAHSLSAPSVGEDREVERVPRSFEIAIAGQHIVADPAGALYWPDQGLLAVADLHLEKGSSYAARGVFLPPYDSAATLARLARLIAHYAPRCVIALGDSFHDGGGPARLSADDRENLANLQRGRDWIWITGNHDPEPAANIGGTFHETMTLGAVTFRHLPTGTANEICGRLYAFAAKRCLPD